MNITPLPSGHYVVIFNNDESDQVINFQKENEKDKLVYVCRDGTSNKYLYPDRFVVENYHTSMLSHLLYENKILEDQQEEHMLKMAQTFIETGRQVFIEEYEFSEADPFYDYSKL